MKNRLKLKELVDTFFTMYSEPVSDLITRLSELNLKHNYQNVELRQSWDDEYDVYITREETDIEYENRMADLAEKKQQQKLAKKQKEEKEKEDYLRLKKKYGDKL